MKMLHQNDRGRTALLPRTLPVQTMEDVTPYHWTLNEQGQYSLRRGAAPKVVAEATADFAEGKVGLDAFLDRLGVPKS
jgi:hypothetical protein